MGVQCVGSGDQCSKSANVYSNSETKPICFVSISISELDTCNVESWCWH